MRSELSTALLSGLGGMLGWGLADFFAKKTIDQVGSIVSLVWAHAFGTAVLLSVTLVAFLAFERDLTLPDGLGSWALLLFFGALQATVYLLAYEGFGKGQVAVLNPIFASYSGLVAIVSVLVFGCATRRGLGRNVSSCPPIARERRKVHHAA